MALNERIVVAGLGSIGRRHARLLAERADVAIELCDPVDASVALTLAELGEHPVHTDFETMLATGPDHVLIASPHQFHVSQAAAALAAGANVLCEKPVSDDLDAATSLFSAAEGASGILGFGFHLHFHPAIVRMRALLATGGYGEPVRFGAHVGSYLTLVNSASRYQARMRGALLLDYTHQADLAQLFLCARPAGVYARGLDVPGPELTSSPNLISLICDYDTAHLSSIDLNYVQDPDREDCEVVATRGWLHFDAKRGVLRHARSGGDVEVEAIRPERDDIYRAEHAAFLAAARGERPTESPLSAAIVSLEVAEAALRSLDSGAREALRPRAPDPHR